MQGLGWLAAIIVGGLAGWIASSIMKADTGMFLNIILGIVGAVVGNALLGLVGLSAQSGSWVAQGVAGVGVLARSVGVQVRVFDAGLLAPAPGVPAEVVRRGTGDFTAGPALSRDEVVAALELGIRQAELAHDEGVRCLATGEVGIGNTTPAAALIAAFTGATAAAVTGRGADSPPEMVAVKTDVIARALALHRPDPSDSIGVLAAVGGVEQAVLTGLVLGAARLRLPVLLDGITGVAAGLAAVALCSAASGYLIAAHAGAEPGIAIGLARLGLDPLLDLGLALGEGSGAVLAVPIVRAAAAILTDMATLDSLLG